MLLFVGRARLYTALDASVIYGKKLANDFLIFFFVGRVEREFREFV